MRLAHLIHEQPSPASRKPVEKCQLEQARPLTASSTRSRSDYIGATPSVRMAGHEQHHDAQDQRYMHLPQLQQLIIDINTLDVV